MMNCNVFGRKQSWFNFEVLFQHLLGGTEGNHDGRFPGRDLNPRFPDMRQVLTTRLRRSVKLDKKYGKVYE